MKITVNGISIAYEKYGEGEKTILLLHGNGEDGSIFKELAEKLSSDATVYCLDTRGHGASEYALPFTIEQFALDVLAFMEKLELTNVLLIGYSDGANIAMKSAAVSSARLSRMVLVCGNTLAKGLTSGFLTLAKISYGLSACFSFSEKVKRKRALLKLMLDDIGVSEEALKNFTVPCDVVCAQDDVVRTDHSRFIAASIPQSTINMLPATNHYNIIYNEKLLQIIKSALI